MDLAKKVIAAIFVSVACQGLSASARANDAAAVFPSKPVRIVIGPTGNFTDIIARQLAQRLPERWRQPVVVDNRASGMIAAAAVAQAAPDGHTLLISDRTWQALAQLLHKDLPYDPVRDFSQISLLASTPNILIAHPAIPITSLKELLVYAKTLQVPLHYATAGIGTMPVPLAQAAITS